MVGHLRGWVRVLARREHGELHVLPADVPRPVPQRRRAVLERVPVVPKRESKRDGGHRQAGVMRVRHEDRQRRSGGVAPVRIAGV